MASTFSTKFFRSSSGFTLTEVLVTMVIAGIVTASIYGVQVATMKTCSVQEQVVQMQQNLRAALEVMSDEIRMAGYVGDGGATTAGISTSSSATQIIFTLDLDEDGDTADSGEYVDYALFTEGGVQKLGRNTTDPATGSPADYDAVAEYIEGLDFAYTDDSGAAATGTSITNVTITILGRTAKADPEYSTSATFAKESGGSWGPYSDGYRRQVLATTIHCRNL